MAEKKKILYIVEAMGGGVFTYIVDTVILQIMARHFKHGHFIRQSRKLQKTRLSLSLLIIALRFW